MKSHHECAVSLPVIVLTGHADVPLAVNFMNAGASALLVKPFDADQLFDCIDQAINWDQNTLERRSKLEHIRQCRVKMTERQKKIKLAVLEGAANKVIASQLQLSERTIELERAEILKLFHVKNAVELAVLITQARLGVDPFNLRIDSPSTPRSTSPLASETDTDSIDSSSSPTTNGTAVDESSLPEHESPLPANESPSDKTDTSGNDPSATILPMPPNAPPHFNAKPRNTANSGPQDENKAS